MRHARTSHVPDPPLGPYLAVSAALLVGTFAFMVAMAYPVAAGAGLVGLVVGLIAGRARSRLSSVARRLARGRRRPPDATVDPA